MQHIFSFPSIWIKKFFFTTEFLNPTKFLHFILRGKKEGTQWFLKSYLLGGRSDIWVIASTLSLAVLPPILRALLSSKKNLKMLQSPIGVDKDIKFKWVGGGSRNLNMVIHVYIEF